MDNISMTQPSTKSETVGLSLRSLVGDDGQLYVVLGTTGTRGSNLFTENFSLYLAARPEIDTTQLAVTLAAMEIAFDCLMCVVSRPHPVFGNLRDDSVGAAH
jgi:hypothetical protein